MSEGNEVEEVLEEDIFSQRLKKINDLTEEGIKPFGERFDNSERVESIRARYIEDQEEPQTAIVAGRLTAFRIMGKSIFADVKDSSGKIQIYANNKLLGDTFANYKGLNTGDIVGIEGELFITKKGELTIRANSYKLLSKSMRTLPEKFHGLTDVQQRYRQRYLDLITNDDSKKVFKQRIQIIREIRNYLEKDGYLEVETPMLQPLSGGAAATPFETHYNALSCSMFMRIAPELYLKRLLVGGFEKVFELNRNFRNEGMSRKHNPEFTMIEIYQAYGDCQTMMDLVEDMVTTVAQKVFGTLIIKHSDEKTIDLTRPWKRANYKDLIKEKAGDDFFDISIDEQVKVVQGLGLHADNKMSEVELANEIHEKIIEPGLIQPTFVTRLPEQLVPLAKKCDDDQTLVDVFELEINGQEIAPGYSELNDPIEQRKRFMEQVERGDEGVDEDGTIDEDFLTAMEHGMPPAGGMGIGIDRLVMMLTGAESIRDVVLFPQMKLKN